MNWKECHNKWSGRPVTRVEDAFLRYATNTGDGLMMIGYRAGFITSKHLERTRTCTWLSAKTPPNDTGRYWCVVHEVNDLGISRYQWNVAYNADTKTWSDDCCSLHVTHWMPLPPLPKEE